MKSINKNDLKYFTAHALTGLASNPFLMSMEGKRYLDMKKLSIEALAVESALMVMERLHLVEQTLDKVEQAEIEKEKSIGTNEKSDGNPRIGA